MLPLRCLLGRFGLALGFSAIVAIAQPAARPLTHADFDSWRSIATPTLSRDGKWLAYAYMPQDGDGDLIVREVATGREHRVPVGDLPAPDPKATDENAPPEAPPPARTVKLAFTGDARYLVATAYPTKQDVAAARKAKKKPEEMPRAGIAILNLATGEVARVAEVKSFQVPSKGGSWLAFLKEGKPEAPKADEDAPKTAKKGASPTTGSRTYGTDLVVRDLVLNADNTFPFVTDYSFSRDGRTLLYTVSSRTETANGVYAFTPGATSAPTALLAGKGRYARVAWDREQTQATFVSDQAHNPGQRTARFAQYLWKRGEAAAKAVVTPATKGLPAHLTVSDKAGASFSRDGRKLYIAAGAPPKASRRPPDAAPIAEEDKVTADLWHWRDGFVQSVQKVRATQERNRTYRGVLDLATDTYVQLGDATLPTISLSDDGARAFGQDDGPYRSRTDYDGRYHDVYLVDTATGARKLLLAQQRAEGSMQWSPDGRWACYYQNRHWHLVDTATGALRPLTDKLRVPFYDENDDRPQPPSAHGSAGWTKDSASFLAYDRYDIWQLFVDGRAPVNLTTAEGRRQRLQFRVQRIEPVDADDDERGIDPAKALTLRGESETSRGTGYFQTNFGAATAPRQLLWGDKLHRYVGRAQEADVLLFTAARFDAFPDVYATDSQFAAPRKMTEGDAQRAPYAWGRSELMSFRSADNLPLSATLIKPANFDPQKKYPLIVYIYERLSQNVHNFYNPQPGTSINAPFYASNGYVVLMPDIVYKTGLPGQSALRCVLPAIDAATKLGFIDEKAIGIQGHSWGGYQIAYMLTQTSRFRAAVAGAPVGNMTSAYSGIRWGSGAPRQFQYETGQSRIGRPLQKGLQAYLDNSPIFHIERVTTPVLMMANDQDDAVPWYQGIELFLALRRHGKPSWLFNYNNEFHGLRRRADQKDWTRRMQQYFDHYLKGAPAPEWLEKGIPYLEREEEKEAFNGPGGVTADKL